MPKRDLLQKTAIHNITEKYYNSSQIFFAEYPTGSGKTKILLESALKIFKEQDTSVIISTSNNALVFDMIHKAQEYGLDCSDIEPLIGKKNYIDVDIVQTETFLEESGLKIEDVKEYLSNHEEPLIFQFMEYFNLPHIFEDIISFEDIEIPVDELLVQEKLSNKFSQKISKIFKTKKIYITNHFYMILIYNQIGKNNLDINHISKVPLLIDEAHQLHGAANNFFTNTISLYRSMIYLRLLSKLKFSKKDIKILTKYTHYFKDLCDEDDGEYILKTLRKDIVQKDYIEPLKQVVNKLSNKKNLPALEQKYIRNIKEELINIYYLMKNPHLQVSFSAIKRLPTITSIAVDAPIGLRKMWAKNKSMIVCISGAFRVSTNSTFHDNKWSFYQIGFIPFKARDHKPLDNYYQQWNDRLTTNRVFLVEESIFDKQQAIRATVSELQYTPPKISKDSELSLTYTLSWVKLIASKIAEDFVYKNTLILMTSFDNCEMLYEELSQKENLKKSNYNILYSTADKSMRFLQEEYKKSARSGVPTILIGNISFFTGIDLPNELLNTLIIGKLPFEPNEFLKKKIINHSAFSSVINNRNKAIVTFRQGLGRGIRNKHDRVFIAICDPRLYDKKNKNFLYFLQEMSVSHRRR